ncbi:uncharacterized protein N7511_005150 [Penicillium nucicola]|uniref:uncharacterized protein n=1 Tax=Penicillium nucicola TaxID=1850975 RepID=UPI002545011C|nr:uncharacterized protein N7511_005150 [Penicillium nucicola]KAJ5761768.1 hypothetical protein N7511_005150 [Penicillium nucicola]
MSMSIEPSVPHKTSQDVTVPQITSETLESTVKQLCIFASSPDMEAASFIAHEIESQREQIKTKQNELSEARKKLDEQEKNQSIAMNQWFIEMQKEKANYARVEGEVVLLKESVARKDSKLAESAQRIKNLEKERNTAQSENVSEKAKVNQLSLNITSLQKVLKERDGTIDQLRVTEVSMKDTLSSEKQRNEELEKELHSQMSIIQLSQTRLHKLEGYGFPGHQMDEDSLINGFSGLWDYATEQMSYIMMQDIDITILSNKASLDCFRKSGDDSVRHVPLPRSNSLAAKGMRLALILTILAKGIDKYIFQPNYLLPENAPLRNIMNRLSGTDGDKEFFCRSMLLSIDQQSQQESLQSRILAVIDEVSSYAHKLLLDAQYTEFRQSVANVAQRAIEVWLPIQRAQQKFEPDFDPLSWGDNEWVMFNLPGEDTEKDTTAHGVASDTLLTVFPRISQVKDQRRHPLTFVTQITRSHPLYIQAEREFNAKPDSPTIGRMFSNGTRRKSIAVHTDNLKENGLFKKKTNGA